MSITIIQVCDAIETTLAAAPDLGSGATQSMNELSEGIADEPTVQIYWESSNQDPSGNTDRTTFKAGVRHTVMNINVDVIARQRRELGEDMGAVARLTDAVVTVLETQDNKPYFGLEGIRAFSWSAERVLFLYGDPEIRYVGSRFRLVVHIF